MRSLSKQPRHSRSFRPCNVTSSKCQCLSGAKRQRTLHCNSRDCSQAASIFLARRGAPLPSEGRGPGRGVRRVAILCDLCTAICPNRSFSRRFLRKHSRRFLPHNFAPMILPSLCECKMHLSAYFAYFAVVVRCFWL